MAGLQSAEIGLLGRAAPYLKRAVLGVREAVEGGVGAAAQAGDKVVAGAEKAAASGARSASQAAEAAAEKGAGVEAAKSKGILGVAAQGAAKMAVKGAEWAGGGLIGFGSKIALGLAGKDVMTEFLSRAVFGNDAVQAQHQADGSMSGYEKGIMTGVAAVGGMWMGRRVAGGGLRAASTKIAEQLRDPDSALRKAASWGVSGKLAAAAGAAEKAEAGVAAAGPGRVNAAMGSVFGKVEGALATDMQHIGRFSRGVGNAIVGEDGLEKPGVVAGVRRRVASVFHDAADVYDARAGVLRSGGVAGLAEREAAYASRAAQRAASSAPAARAEGAVSEARAPAGVSEVGAGPVADARTMNFANSVHAAPRQRAAEAGLYVQPASEHRVESMTVNQRSFSEADSARAAARPFDNGVYSSLPGAQPFTASHSVGAGVRGAAAREAASEAVEAGDVPGQAARVAAVSQKGALLRMGAGVAALGASAWAFSGGRESSDRSAIPDIVPSPVGTEAQAGGSARGAQKTAATSVDGSGSLAGRVEDILPSRGAAQGASQERLVSAGHILPSTAMQLAGIDRRMGLAALAMDLSDVSDPKAHVGFQTRSGVTQDGSSFFTMTRSDREMATGNRQFSVVAAADGRGGMSESEMLRDDARARISRTVVAAEPGVVSGGINAMSGQVEPRFGPKAHDIAAAIGDLSRRPSVMAEYLSAGAKEGHEVNAHIVQTTGPEASQIIGFAVRHGGGKDAPVDHARIDLSNGYGRMVMLASDGKTETWSKQLQGVDVSMNSTGRETLAPGAIDSVRRFMADPSGFARETGPSMDPGRDLGPRPVPARRDPEQGADAVARSGTVSSEPRVDVRFHAPGQAAVQMPVSDTISGPAPESSGVVRGRGAGVGAGMAAASAAVATGGAASVSDVRSGVVEPSAAAWPGARVTSEARAAEAGLAGLRVAGRDVGREVQLAEVSGGEISREGGRMRAFGASGTAQAQAGVLADGSRFETGRFVGRTPSGETIAVVTAATMDPAEGSMRFAGASNSVQKGVSVSRSVSGEIAGVSPESVPVLSKAALRATRTGLAFDGAGGAGADPLVDAMSTSTLRKGMVSDSLTLAPAEKGSQGMLASRETRFSGLDQDDHRVSGAIRQDGTGISMTLFGPDGRTPQFRMELDRSRSSASTVASAMRDFIHDPKGYESEHQAKNLLPEVNAGVGRGGETSQPGLAGLLKANAVFKSASPDLASWADMAERKYLPQTGMKAAQAGISAPGVGRNGGMSF